MLREFEDKECCYFDADAPEMLDRILGKGLIELLKSRHPEEIGITNDPNYCNDHGTISSPIEKCKAFRK